LESDTNRTFEIAGEYWTTGNLGTTVDGVTVNVPVEAIPDTRTNGIDRTYAEGLRNKAVYTKIYEVSNPTNAIAFDIPKATVTGADFASRYAYDYAKDKDTDLWYEDIRWDYSLEYSIRIVQFMIVVEWGFNDALQ
jgi:hypothetical protein